MSEWNYPGARWWKFDFHTHTPKSKDFMRGCSQEDKNEVIPEFWLRKFMEKGIDCVAITDHNSGDGVDKLKQELEKLKQNKPDWYRPLYLFPGVEISANSGVHILAIFGCNKDKGDIDQLLGAVGYRGEKDRSDAVTEKSVIEVINAIDKQGGIAIPAHVDKEKGLFKEVKGTSLEQVLDNPNIHAIELCNDGFDKPQLYKNKKLNWTEVCGSDVHNFDHNNFGKFTWIKMDEPSIEGLRLALIDGGVSVNRDMSSVPNRHAEFVIEELEINKAKYIGRVESLKCRFSPFLNTIIGGRGSGKSTLLEFMRFALRRDKEIPQELQRESSKYFNVGDQNLLTEDSQISLVYCKGDRRYRLRWSAEADVPSLEEEKNDIWVRAVGEIKSLFPAYIYSQKQIFELAKNPCALIDVVDKAPEIDYPAIDKKRRELVNRYKQIEQRVRELDEGISQENRLRGESNDLARQIQQIEKSGHKAVLQNYRKRQQQLNEIENLESDWQEMSERLSEIRGDIVPALFSEQNFTEHDDILSALRKTNEKWQSISNRLQDLVREARLVVQNWKNEKDRAVWMQALKVEMARYEQLRTQLEQQGIDPKKYPGLLLRQKILQEELQQIDRYKSRKAGLEDEKEKVLKQVKESRRKLSEERQKFLTNVLQDNPSVNIKVKPFGEAWNSIEKDIRRILQCPDHFGKDIEHLKSIYHKSDNERIEELKNTILNIRSGDKNAKDNRFVNHLQSLPQESISDFTLWFPGDDLKITFGPDNQQIEQGSPGQKTAALLAFILSYGSQPLLLDQPEDDLDNELIYSLIVRQLRETKSKRQIIVVTHNANIVVNGDAEMVLPLTVGNGQSFIEHAASIQDSSIREKICNILEGGQQAFEQRYKRIHLEQSSV